MTHPTASAVVAMHRLTNNKSYLALFKYFVITLFLFNQSIALAEEKSLTLGFDGLPEFSLDVGQFGVAFNGASVLTCGSSLNCTGFPPFSGRNVVYDTPGFGGIITAEFDHSITGAVTEVSARVTGNTNIDLKAYDIDGGFIDGDLTGGPNYVGSGGGSPNKRLVVNAADKPIFRVTFSDSGNTFTIDDFSFISNPRKVVVDPGHGKIAGNYQRDVVTKYNIVEDELTLSISQSLGDSLITEGVSVVFTRTSSNAPFATPTCGIPCFTDLNERGRFAKKQEADVFVSIHTNAGPPKAHGVETYRPAGTTSERALDSSSLSNNVQAMLTSLGLRDRGPKVNGYNIFNYHSTPSILTEVGFHSNTELDTDRNQTVTDGERLSQASFRQQAGSKISDGVIMYLDEKDASDE